ncbi:PLDc N-terminal domain-containing protein [Tropicimonas sp. S265A]|uniref:PLDc N-terminal domain-containing protein n=1 Tax=Tropicimonas sp. S265A TaxID=3415134 RepID=UPI003C7E8FF6
MIEIAGIGGLILLVLNVWAFISIVTSGASTGATVLWIVLVLILPLFGFIIWLLFGLRARA